MSRIYYTDNINYNTRFVSNYFYYIKIILAKTVFLISLILSVFLIVNYKHQGKANKRLTNFVDNISIVPHFFVVSSEKIVLDLCEFLQNIFFIYKENKNLLVENRKLKYKLLQINYLKNENNELKDIVNFFNSEINNSNTVSTKPYLITSSRFTHKMKVNLGTKDGLNEGNLVFNNIGELIGRLIRVEENTSEVMLLTDIDSKIPVITQSNRMRLILNGNNTKYLDISYHLYTDSKINENDLVYTTNDGNILPSGLYIGKIIKVNKELKIEIDRDQIFPNMIIIQKK